ncbi:MAG: molybdopterin molybdenumtransferase MoeA, partial [Planctomycetota bacterium]
MVTFEQARDLVEREVRTLEAEPVPLNRALGRSLVHDPVSLRDVPGFQNSAMDGYAVRLSDCQLNSTLEIAGIQAAGDAPIQSVRPGSCVRVMTGGVVPNWADAVIPREETDESEARCVRLASVPRMGANIRKANEDVAAGTLLRLKGRPLSPSDLGVLASIGKSSVAVHRRPVVSLVCTGGELLNPQDTPREGFVVNSNAV